MQTTRLSSKGQVIIPKAIRDAYHLNVGQELEIEITPQGILLKTKSPLPKSSINDLIGCTGYRGKPLTLDDMEAAIQKGVSAEVGWTCWRLIQMCLSASSPMMTRNKPNAPQSC